MSVDPKTHAWTTWVAVAVLLVFALVVWLPALATPFWGDDYSFLLGAHAANLAAESWWSAFWPASPSGFWRPLSHESWWRFVDVVLSADPVRAHVANLVLLALAAGSVGILALSIARSCDWPEPVATAALGGMIYGNLALHFLPVHWAAAANNSILVVFTSLILAAWIEMQRARSLRRMLLVVCIPVLLVAALLSKESAALIPVLMVILGLFVGKGARRRLDWFLWCVCVALVVAWLFVRAGFIADTDSNYDLVVGSNIFRNGFSLVAWLLNVPREALRLIVTGQAGLGIPWAAASASLMIAAWVIAARHRLSQFTPRQMVFALVFCVVAYAPYLPLAWNSYAYYAAIAAILPAIVLAHGLSGSRFAVVAAVLVGLSSWLAVAGSRWLDNPGLIGRAHWAEATLQSLVDKHVGSPLWVRSADPHRFYAIGPAGLAWRLGIDPGSVRQTDACPSDSSFCLGIDADGNVHLTTTGTPEIGLSSGTSIPEKEGNESPE